MQLPMSLEAEEALLGAVLLEPKSYLTIAAFLNGEDFFLKRHEYIWNAFSRLQERNDAIDYVTLARELQAMSVLDEIGGQAYLTNLVNKTPSAVHAEVYGEMVSRTSTRRKMLIAADTIRQTALDEELPIDKVISEAEQALFNVSNSQIKREFVPIWEAVSDYYDRSRSCSNWARARSAFPPASKGWTACWAAFKSRTWWSSPGVPAWARPAGS